MFLMVDSKDSFVWNLVRYLERLDVPVTVLRSDRLDLDQVLQQPYTGIILSPGPGRPDRSGLLLPLLARLNQLKKPLPVLGVCLGHQALAQAHGGRIICAERPMYGKVTPVWHDGAGVYRQLPNPLQVTRYHALIVDPDSLPAAFQVSCRSADGTIMGIRHRYLPQEGVQFHPEAELTQHGLLLLKNFVDQARAIERKQAYD